MIEWNALFNNWRAGAKDPSSRGANATNVTFAAMDPFFAMVRFTSSKTVPPVSNNWGYFTSLEFDELIAAARTTFDGPARDVALSKLHARIVEEAPFLWVAHDVGPRAISPKVKGVVQPKSWFIDMADDEYGIGSASAVPRRLGTAIAATPGPVAACFYTSPSGSSTRSRSYSASRSCALCWFTLRPARRSILSCHLTPAAS